MFSAGIESAIDVRLSVKRPGNTLLATLPLEDYQRVDSHLTIVPLRVLGDLKSSPLKLVRK